VKSLRRERGGLAGIEGSLRENDGFLGLGWKQERTTEAGGESGEMWGGVDRYSHTSSELRTRPHHRTPTQHQPLSLPSILPCTRLLLAT